MKFVKKYFVLLLSSILCISALTGCTPIETNHSSAKSSMKDKIDKDDIIEDDVIYDDTISDSYVKNNLVYDDQIYECKISDEIVSDVYLIDIVISDSSEEEIESQLPDQFKEYEIDWPSVIGKFAVGTAVIIAVGVANYASNGSTFFVFGSASNVAKDALVAGAIAAALNTGIRSASDGEISVKAKKYAIEGFADGYMWGAISSVLKTTVKNYVHPKRLVFSDKSSLNVKPDASVVNKAGEVVGKAYYKSGKIITVDSATNAINVFDKNGKQIALSAAKLSKNSILKFGEGKAATICRTDQLGGIYRAGDELIANNTYVLNGYKYSTDSTGRIIEAVADKLELKDHQGRKLILESAKLIGRGFEKATDDRGHLFADLFGGDNTLGNIVSMDSNLNRSQYKALEQTWRAAIESGKKVQVDISLSYSADSFRPDKFNIVYKIGKEISKVVFENAM